MIKITDSLLNKPGQNLKIEKTCSPEVDGLNLIEIMNAECVPKYYTFIRSEFTTVGKLAKKATETFQSLI